MPGCGVHGNDKDARSRGNLPDTGYGLHAAEFGHGNIQQDEIGPERLREPDACEPVPASPATVRPGSMPMSCFRPLRNRA